MGLEGGSHSNERAEKKDTQEAMKLQAKLGEIQVDPLLQVVDRPAEYKMMLEKAQSPEFVEARKKAAELLETGDMSLEAREELEGAVRLFDEDVKTYSAEA